MTERRSVDKYVKRRIRMLMVAWFILAAAVVGGYVSLQHLAEERRADRDAQVAQFCTAIPNASAAGAQALIDILISDALRRGMPQARLDRLNHLGRLYVARARELALSDLPSCKEPK